VHTQHRQSIHAHAQAKQAHTQANQAQAQAQAHAHAQAKQAQAGKAGTGKAGTGRQSGHTLLANPPCLLEGRQTWWTNHRLESTKAMQKQKRATQLFR
jgi:hypothetical protein